jgi:hypothetical protein
LIILLAFWSFDLWARCQYNRRRETYLSFSDFACPNLPQAEQTRLRTAAVDAYDHQFLPAWRKYQDYLKGTYAAKVRPGDSVSSMTRGREAYAILVRRFTTTNMTPQAIHKLGEEEVSRLETEMRALLQQSGFTGAIAEFEKQIAASPARHFQTKDEMLAYCRNIAKIIEPELPNLFRKIPILLYGIRPVPPDREANEANTAQAPAPDYSAPGWFNLNTFQAEKQVKYDKEALVLHEAVPGHIFELTLARALEGLPEIHKFYRNSAYGEGWALYPNHSDRSSAFSATCIPASANWLASVSAQCGWLWTRESMRTAGPAKKPSSFFTSTHRTFLWPKWIVILRGLARPFRTKSASSGFANCARWQSSS